MMNIFHAAGVSSLHIARLGIFVLGLFAVVTAVMCVLVVWLTLRRRGTIAEHAPWNDEGSRSWILVGGLAIPTAVLALTFGLSLKTMAALPMDDQHHAAPQLRVIGHQWWWEVQYLGATPDQSLLTANEIHIPAGQPVEIELISRDVIHSFWVPRLHGKVDLVPGETNRIQLDALEAGLYEGHCAEFCGAEHARMHLRLKAEPEQEFDRWMEAQRAPAAPPKTADEAAGQRLFMSKACALCHTIRGTDARGSAGPDLTHVGARTGLAADSYTNDDSNLRTWVTHAQSLKPNAQMPDIAAFSNDDLRELAAYLRHLT